MRLVSAAIIVALTLATTGCASSLVAPDPRLNIGNDDTSSSAPNRPSTFAVPIAEADFRPVNPALPDGPAIAVLRGDPATGPSEMLLRMGPGTSPMHVHSHDYSLVIIEGRMKHWARGDSEADAKILAPGSYWFQPAHEPHSDSCLDEVCLMFITWSGPRDAMLAPETGTEQ